MSLRSKYGEQSRKVRFTSVMSFIISSAHQNYLLNDVVHYRESQIHLRLVFDFPFSVW